LVGWVRVETADVADPVLAKLLAQLTFAVGGVGYAVPFALLVAGVSVPALILRLLPRALGWAGLVIAVVGVLATGAILTPVLDVALPVTRFGGALSLIAVGFLLPPARPRRQPRN
jgi:hypothetical protein